MMYDFRKSPDRIIDFGLNKLKTISVLFLFLVISRIDAQNLISNGDFESSFTNWNNLAGGGSVANYSIETTDVNSGNGALKVQISSLGVNEWDVQSIHSGFAATVNQEYVLTLYAKAIINGTSLRAVVQNSSYNATDFILTNTWQKYTWTFTAQENNLQLKFHYISVGAIFIDDIFIEANNPSTNDPALVVVDPTTTYQDMIGFGHALTWHCDRITSSPKKQEIADLLFLDLGCDIVRFKNWYYPLNYPSNKNPQNSYTSWFVPHYNATNELYNLAVSRNPNMDFLLSSWGPPVNMKSNNLLEGGTLKKVNGQFMYSEFAQYWKDVLTNLSFNPTYISIQNEPDFQSSWTTCEWRPTETVDFPGYDLAFDNVYNQIKSLPNRPLMIGPEVANLGYDSDIASNTMQGYSNPIRNKEQLSAYAYHPYNFNGSTNINDTKSIFNMFKNDLNNKPNILTEYSGYMTWLNTAALIQRALTEANASGYVYWEGMWDETSSNALLSIDATGNYTISPYYYVVKHFAKYVDKGYKRISTNDGGGDLKVSGFINSEGNSLTFIVVNTSNQERSLSMNFGVYSVSNIVAYQSTEGNYFQTISPSNLTNLQAIPAQSITSYKVSLTPVIIFDCNGVANGTAYLDACQNCVSGNTGELSCTLSDNDPQFYGFKVFPNPIKDGSVKVKLSGYTEVSKLDLYDITGRMVYSAQNLNQREITINVKRLEKGIYILKVCSNGKIESQKIVIK